MAEPINGQNVTAPTELYPGQAEELRKRGERLADIERAHGAVLPGALKAAFSDLPATAAGHELQPVNLALCAALEQVDSPILEVVRILRETMENPDGGEITEEARREKSRLFKEKTGALKFDSAQAAEAIFIFTRPPGRVQAALKAGREKFRELALAEIGEKLHPAQGAVLTRACVSHYVTSFATIIGYGVPPPEGETVFPRPSASAAMDSAGGSTSSAR